MRRCLAFLALILAAQMSRAQFVYPAESDHDHDADVYKEDPFITHYRKEFFAVFKGDFPRFEKAYAEIKAMSAKNPRDPRAMIWLGNGQTVEAGVLRMKGDNKRALEMLKTSRATMDRAVAIHPKDPQIYMMRAATLYIQGQYWESAVPKKAWAELRDDCLRLIHHMGPKLSKASVHVRGETYGELAVAYEHLGARSQAIGALRTVAKMNPGTDYEERAKKELSRLHATP